MFKEIDTKKWERKGTFEYFKGFSNPCYGFDVEMDIDDIYKITKETKTSFFINFLYLLTIGLNKTEELRYRIVDDKVVCYDICHPSYIVLKDSGYFENAYNKMTDNYKDFYKLASEEIEYHKNNSGKQFDDYNDNYGYDVFYCTCIPWIKYETINHPIPDKDLSSQSVPRICWGKYYEKNGRMKVLLNITVSHVLCDGYPLSKAFIEIQKVLDDARKYLI